MRFGNRITAACLPAFVVLLCLAATATATADWWDEWVTPDASAFQAFPTYGISMLPGAFGSGQPTYDLTLSAGAYLLCQGTEYPIAKVWGFYALTSTGEDADRFTATGSDIGQWHWGQKPTNGSLLSVGGWLNAPKDEALEPPTSGSVTKQFTYGQFQFSGVGPVLGLDVTVTVPEGKSSPFGSGVTGHILPFVVPEPSCIIAVLTGLGMVALRRRS